MTQTDQLIQTIIQSLQLLQLQLAAPTPAPAPAPAPAPVVPAFPKAQSFNIPEKYDHYTRVDTWNGKSILIRDAKTIKKKTDYAEQLVRDNQGQLSFNDVIGIVQREYPNTSGFNGSLRGMTLIMRDGAAGYQGYRPRLRLTVDGKLCTID